MLRADDELIDSLPMNHLSFTSTPSSRSWKSVLLQNPVPPPPSLSPPSPSPEPASPSPSLHKPRKVCQYWLAVSFFPPHLTAREIACMATSAGTPTPSTRKPPSRSWSTSRSAAFARKTYCSHVFCLECIRNWRYSHIGDPSVRRCPLCRATSFYIIPSKEPVFDPDAKQKIIEAYKKNMSRRNSEEWRGRNPVQVFQRRNGRLSLRGVVLLFAQAGQWTGVRAANRYAGRRRAARHRTCMIVEMAK